MLLVSGCAAEWSINKWGGDGFVAFLGAAESDVLVEAAKECQKISRFLEPEIVYRKESGGINGYPKYFKYHCKETEFSKNLSKTREITVQKELEFAANKEKAEKEKLALEEKDNIKKRVEQTKAEQQSTLMSLDEAKKRCIDLGFKPVTERFGQCVLRLSK
jgi:hypothetical protein